MMKSCIQIKQSDFNDVVITSMNIQDIERVCMISRVHRNDTQQLIGYQRAEVSSHIDNIARYLSDEKAVIPNSIIICFNSSTSISINENGIGTLKIPTNIRTGLIIDGQQRVAALRKSGRNDFYFPVTIFITDDEEFERTQFLLINSAKPLSKSLVYELIPYVKSGLTSPLMRKKMPSKIIQYLNYDKLSPLYGYIKLNTNPSGIIADNSIMKFIDNSLREGALYDFLSFSNGEFEEDNFKKAIEYINGFFSSVHEVFPQDWGRKPRESRLFHGAGIICLGQIFDEIYYEYKHKMVNVSFKEFAVEMLSKLKPICHWSSGVWDFGVDLEGVPIKRKWNQIQNIPTDISMLSRYLLIKYNEVNGRKSFAKGK